MDSERLLFILVGVVIVFAVGQLLVRSGRRYLAGAAPGEKASAGPAANLVAVLFHLLTLGIVALLAVLDLGSTTETRFLVQLGIFLVVLAAVYSIALMLINRRRDEALAVEVETYGDVRHEPVAAEHPERRPMSPLDPQVDVRPIDPTRRA